MAIKNDPLTNFRRINKLTQEELASYLGVSKSFVSQIENGRVDLPYEQRQRILQNDRNWDVSALLESSEGGVLSKGQDTVSSVDAALVAALREAQAQNAKSQAQIDRLLSIIEIMQRIK